MISADLPPNLMGDYHLSGNGSPASIRVRRARLVPATQGGGTLNAPTVDIDNRGRPGFLAFDIGADEITPANANLGISKSDSVTVVNNGQALTYTIVVSNAGPDGVTGATVTDNFPATLSPGSWTCSASVGSSCTATTGSGNIATTVNLLNGGTATFTVTATVNAASGSVVNTAIVAAPANVTDPTPGNNSATDTDTITAAANKHVGDLDRTGLVIGNLPWSATVTITVHNSAEGPVANATVNGSWSGGGLGGTSCTTNASGTCNVLRFRRSLPIRRAIPSQ